MRKEQVKGQRMFNFSGLEVAILLDLLLLERNNLYVEIVKAENLEKFHEKLENVNKMIAKLRVLVEN